MSKKRDTTVLFIWNVNETLKSYLTDALEHLSNVKLVFPSDVSQESLITLAPEADIIVGWLRRPTKELLLAAQKLHLFITSGVGVEHLIDPFRKINRSRRVLLANCHGHSYFVAQHAVALLLALTNKIIPHHNWMVAGEWRKGDDDAISTPLRDRKVGLLGYGAVNQKVHRFLLGFDAEFSILRRDWSKQSGELPTPVRGYVYSELHSFLAVVNILIVAVPLTSLTRGLIQMRELRHLGSDGLLVNVGRGAVVDEKDLYTALKDKIIAGAAIDVWYTYNPKPDKKVRKYPFSYPLHTLENVILSPHRAASPLNDLRRWNEVIENIGRFAKGERQFINIINLEEEY